MSHLCRCICHLATKKREEQAPDFNIDFEVKSKWQTWNKIKKDCKKKKRNKIAHLLFIITSLNLTVYKTDAVNSEISQLDGREKKRQTCVTSVTIILFEISFRQTSLSFKEIFL